jgi:dihydropteroate synthase
MILIALGANLPSVAGAHRETLRRALFRLEQRGLRIIRKSRTYLTEPVPRSSQPWYANQVVSVETSLDPHALLALLLDVEHEYGRERGVQDAARTLDLDLIDYDGQALNTENLVLPHPRMHQRGFVLAPLAEIAPDWRHPLSHIDVGTLLAQVDLSGIRAMRDVPLLMGVVNVTPDSFSDGGSFSETSRAIAHAELLIEEGADILDIGGESTRPGALPVSVEEEQRRVLPVVRAIAREAIRQGRHVSVDTRHPSTMAAAIEAGATMINDVTALASRESRKIVAQAGVPVFLMHMQGNPQTMQVNPSYDDVVSDVSNELRAARDRAVADGIDPDLIWLDPGIGFGKTLAHNLALLDATPRLRALGHRVLIGASRKGFIARVDRDGPANERIGGSIAAAISAAARGADALRVHDVRETRQALAVWSAIEGN